MSISRIWEQTWLLSQTLGLVLIPKALIGPASFLLEGSRGSCAQILLVKVAGTEEGGIGLPPRLAISSEMSDGAKAAKWTAIEG
jgi:hypothetical protein